MTDEEIFYGDPVVFDEAIRWNTEAIGVYWLEDGFSLLKEVRHPDGLGLVSINPTVKAVRIPEDETLERLGIVAHIVKSSGVSGTIMPMFRRTPRITWSAAWAT